MGMTDRDAEIPVPELISQAVSSKAMREAERCLFLESLASGGIAQASPSTLRLSPHEFVVSLCFTQSIVAIMAAFEQRFGQAALLESFMAKYFKIRIGKNEATLGAMYAFVEAVKRPEWNLEAYAITPTTLEMIFNQFAQEH